MNKKAKQLRELRNKIIHKGDVPLEFGCEIVDKKGKEWNVVFFVKREYISTITCLSKCGKWEKQYQDTNTILGKPTSWGDVLRMIGNEYDIKLGGKDEIILKEFGGRDMLTLDLRKSPEKQDEDTLQRLITIII